MMRALVLIVVAALMVSALIFLGDRGQDGSEDLPQGPEQVDLGTDIKDDDERSADSSGVRDLESALIEGDLARVRRLVAQGVDLEAREGEDKPPLLLAVGFAGWEEVECLLDGGAEIDAATDLGVTPLLHAVFLGKDEIALKLIERGANVDAKNSMGSSVLILAINEGSEAVARRLIEQGADVNVQSSRYRTTALMTASGKDMLEVARLLVDRGADLEVRDAFGLKARNYAKTRAMRDLLTPDPPDDDREKLDDESALDVTDAGSASPMILIAMVPTT